MLPVGQPEFARTTPVSNIADRWCESRPRAAAVPLVMPPAAA